MNLVIPVGRARPTTLPYALRSLAVNTPVTNLITVGERPEGIEPDQHIDSTNTELPHLNIAGHLRRVIEQTEGPFIWCDDDTFTVKPWTPAVYVRDYSIAAMLEMYPNRGRWSQAVRSSIDVMRAWGYDPEKVPCGTVHRPWLVDPAHCAVTLDGLESVGGGSFKALYVAGVKDPVVAGDPKVWGREMPKPGADVISVFNDSWRYNAGRIIRETFTQPSRWEPEPTSGTDTSTSGPATASRRHRRR